MGRKYYYPKRDRRHGGKAGLIGALVTAIAGRGRSHRYPPHRYDSYGYAPAYRRRSVKSSIVSYILKRLLKKFL